MSDYAGIRETGCSASDLLRLSLLVLLVFALSPIRSALAQEPDPCSRALVQADARYVAGQFEEAVEILATCLNQSDATRQQTIEAYRLLTLAYLRMEHTGEARAAIIQIFRTDPTYRPDPINDPPSYTVLVEIVRNQMEPATPAVAEETAGPRQQSWLQSNLGWVLAGGALVAGGLAVAILSGGNGGGGDSGSPSILPPPPSTPGRP